MNTISQEFAILPGVMGSCVSGRNNGIFFSSMPVFFTEKMVEEASNNIGRMMQMAKVKGLDPQAMSILYDKFIIIAMPIDSSTTLLILCEPGCNTSLVSTTATMLAPEIKNSLDNDSGSAPESTDETLTPENNTEQDRQLAQQTDQALRKIKEALFDTIGPVADMVYDECIERWTSDNSPNISRIFELIGCISIEIDDPSLFEEFKEKITDLL